MVVDCKDDDNVVISKGKCFNVSLMILSYGALDSDSVKRLF